MTTLAAQGRKGGRRRRTRLAVLLAAWHQAERDLGLLRNVTIDEANLRASQARLAYLRAVERPPTRPADGESGVAAYIPELGDEASKDGQRAPLRRADGMDPGLRFEEDIMWPYEAEWAS